MVSSHFAGPVGFRPTPQTCFPPRDPDPDPGFVACMDRPFSQWSYIHIRFDCADHRPGQPQRYAFEGRNMTNARIGVGLREWTARIVATGQFDVVAGIRCITTPYAPPEWQTYLSGSIRTADGAQLHVNGEWQPTAVTVSPPGNQTTTATWLGQSAAFPPNNLGRIMAITGTLIELPRPPESRPPNPMIPDIT